MLGGHVEALSEQGDLMVLRILACVFPLVPIMCVAASSLSHVLPHAIGSSALPLAVCRSETVRKHSYCTPENSKLPVIVTGNFT